MKIKQKYNHTCFGNFMFKLCAGWTIFIVKHKWLYYTLSLTYGLIMTVFGGFCTLVLGFVKLFNKKITFEKFYWIYLVKAGPDRWGGFETGLMFVRDHLSDDVYINNHEFGHTFQNTLFGPLSIFLCFLPSVTRYWFQTIREYKGLKNKDYDSFWVEDAASQCGKYAVEYLKAKNK